MAVKPTFTATKQDWLEDCVNALPPETADLDWLVKGLPKLDGRSLAALSDALQLLQRKANDRIVS